MLENQVDALIKKVRDEVITDSNMKEIPLAYLMTRNIPESIKHFFNQEVELWIREEEDKFSTSDRFDYDMPEVRILIDQIFDLLKQNARFHINKFNQLLERAIKLEMNYLIEPQRTLSQFIFKNNPVVSTMEVYDTLKYFFKYGYYKDAISDYFNTKYLHEISQDQFQVLIAQIDEKIFKENTFETTLKTIKTISNFINESTGLESDDIDLEVILHAFRDRNLNTYTELIEHLKAKDEKLISFSSLENILRDESLQSLEPVEREAEIAEEQPLKMEEIKDIEESKPEVEVDEIEIGEMKIEPVEEEEEDEEEEEEEEIAAEPIAVKSKVADEMADFVASQMKSDQPLQNLNDMIMGRTRKKIIKKLFNKNEKAFLSFIKLVNDQSAWKEASIVIDEAFYEHGINPYSKEAIIFSDIIYLRFFPKDKYVGEQDHM